MNEIEKYIDDNSYIEESSTSVDDVMGECMNNLEENNHMISEDYIPISYSTHIPEEDISQKDFIEEESISIEELSEILNLKTNISKYSENIDNFKEMKYIGSDKDTIDILEERTLSLSVEQVHEMTDDEVKAIFTDKNGKRIKTIVENGIDNDEIVNRQRDYLLFIANSNSRIKEMEDIINNLNTESEKYNKEIEEIKNRFQDLSSYMYISLTERVNNTEDEEEKIKLENHIKLIDQTFTLEYFFSKIENMNIQNMFNAYKDEKYRTNILEAFQKQVINTLKLNFKPASFSNLEEKFLQDKYRKYPDLFLFSLIRIFYYERKEIDKDTHGVVLSWLNIYLQELFSGEMGKEKKIKFLENIEKFMDLLYY